MLKEEIIDVVTLGWVPSSKYRIVDRNSFYDNTLIANVTQYKVESTKLPLVWKITKVVNNDSKLMFITVSEFRWKFRDGVNALEKLGSQTFNYECY